MERAIYRVCQGISKGDYGDIGDLADDYLDWAYIDKTMKPNWWPVKEPVQEH